MDKPVSSQFPPAEGAAALEEELLAHLRQLGAVAENFKVVPRAQARRAGLSTTAEIVERVRHDLAELEHRGMLLLGEEAAPGLAAMQLTSTELPAVFSCDQLVSLYGQMNEYERGLLASWESVHLAIGQGSTTAWPGWPTIYFRRYGCDETPAI